MSRRRRDPKIRVWLIDVEEPIDIQTSRLDWVAVTMDPASPKPLDMLCQVAHKALLRTGHDVPTSYLVFLDKCLDGNPDQLDEGDTEMLDPTQQEA